MSQEITPPGAEIPVIDESRLMEEFGGDREILAELRDLFLEHAPPLFESILAAMGSRDLTVVARDGHSLKGACATYGAPRLAMVCKVLELAAKEGDQATVAAHRELFVAEYEKVFESISHLSFC